MIKDQLISKKEKNGRIKMNSLLAHAPDSSDGMECNTTFTEALYVSAV